MNDLIYKTKEDTTSYYRDGHGNKIPGENLSAGTMLLLRNTCCHLLPTDNVFEIHAMDTEDKYYVVLDESQVEYVTGNTGVR